VTTIKREFSYAIRYIVAGVIGNSLVFFIYLFQSSFLESDPNIAFSVACAAVLPLSFLLSANWTFRSKLPFVRTLPMFISGYISSYAIQALILLAGTKYTEINPDYIVLAAQIIAIMFFFSFQKMIIFTHRHDAST
jgi:putative flippase GtrA